jgi:major vault protein
MDIIKLTLKTYVHIKDTITNITYLLEGPKNYALKSNEVIVQKITKYIQLGNSQYIKIKNPVARNEKGEVLYETFGQVKLHYGEIEYRNFNDYKDPFPLYPGEIKEGNIENFITVQANTAIRLRAEYPHFDEVKKKQRKPGEVYMYRGPLNYIPNKNASVENIIDAIIILPNTAIRLRAISETVDLYGVKRIAGEEWLIKEEGSYIPNINELFVNKEEAYTLTDKTAILLSASADFTDIYGIKRVAGSEWLITMENADQHICDVKENFIEKRDIIVLSSRQYCVILNPYEKGVCQYGERKLIKGERSFFLQPREKIEENTIYEIKVLEENDALLLQANEPYKDGEILRQPGDKWLIKGPCEFIKPLQLQILEERKALPLDENEGIYVRDRNTGEIKTVSGQTYLLKEFEELWNKNLSPQVEALLQSQQTGVIFASAQVNKKGEYVYENKDNVATRRIKHKIVTFKAPDNSAVQLFDYKNKTKRYVFGPELVRLNPHEEFTLFSLSGKRPKQENVIKNIAILLGPDFMTDLIEVETRDHARLTLQLSYSWKFEVLDRNNAEECHKIFKCNDFVGDACKIIAAKIRTAVSSVPFETFHKGSAAIVRSAVFGKDEKGNTNSFLKLSANNLLITNVDIQGQEPCDVKTRENLSKLTNLSITSMNQIQKATAEHRQNMVGEESKGRLALQKIEDDTHAEKQNIEFLKRKIETEAVKTSGNLVAKAKATAKSNQIEGESAIRQTQLKVESLEIEVLYNLQQEEENIKEEISLKEKSLDVEIDKLRKLMRIEVQEFKKTVDAIGRETIVEMARAGPNTQAKLLGSLGIKSFMITDGKNPINLFSTAKGMVNSNYSLTD